VPLKLVSRTDGSADTFPSLFLSLNSGSHKPSGVREEIRDWASAQQGEALAFCVPGLSSQQADRPL
jgi:hypothetical protein